MKRRPLSVVLATASLFACQSSDEAALRGLTAAALDAHAQAAVRRDVPAAAALFTEDAAVFFPNSPDIRGRDSIAALMRRSWPVINPTSVRYAVDEVHVRGDLAVTMARYWVSVAPASQPPSTDSGRYMLLWRRQPDGNWRVSRALPNSTAPIGAR